MNSSLHNLPFPLNEFYEALNNANPKLKLEPFISQIRNRNMFYIYQCVNRLLQIITNKSELPLVKYNALKATRYFFDTCDYAAITCIEVYLLPAIYEIGLEKYLKRSKEGVELYFVDRGSENTKDIRRMGLNYVELAAELIFNWAKVKPFRLIENQQLKKEESNFVRTVKIFTNKGIIEPEKCQYFIPSYATQTRKKYLKKLKHFSPEPFISFVITEYLQELNLNKKCDLDIKKLLLFGDSFLTSTMVEIIEEELLNMNENFINKKKYLNLLNDLIRSGEIESIYLLSSSEFLSEIFQEVEKVRGDAGFEQGEYIYRKVEATKFEKKEFYIEFLRCLEIWAYCIPTTDENQQSEAYKIYEKLKKKKFVFPKNVLLPKIKKEMEQNLMINRERNETLLRIINSQESTLTVNKTKGFYENSKGEYRFVFPNYVQKNDFLEFDELQNRVFEAKKRITRLSLHKTELEKNIQYLDDFQKGWDENLQKLDIQDEDPNELQLLVDEGDVCCKNIKKAMAFYNEYKENLISYDKLREHFEHLEQKAEEQFNQNNEGEGSKIDYYTSSMQKESKMDFYKIGSRQQHTSEISLNKSKSSVRERLADQLKNSTIKNPEGSAIQQLVKEESAKDTPVKEQPKKLNNEYFNEAPDSQLRGHNSKEIESKSKKEKRLHSRSGGSSDSGSRKSSRKSGQRQDLRKSQQRSKVFKECINQDSHHFEGNLNGNSQLESSQHNMMRNQGKDQNIKNPSSGKKSSSRESEKFKLQQKKPNNGRKVIHHSVISKSSYRSEPTDPKIVVDSFERNGSLLNDYEMEQQQQMQYKLKRSSIKKTENSSIKKKQKEQLESEQFDLIQRSKHAFNKKKASRISEQNSPPISNRSLENREYGVVTPKVNKVTKLTDSGRKLENYSDVFKSGRSPEHLTNSNNQEEHSVISSDSEKSLQQRRQQMKNSKHSKRRLKDSSSNKIAIHEEVEEYYNTQTNDRQSINQNFFRESSKRRYDAEDPYASRRNMSSSRSGHKSNERSDSKIKPVGIKLCSKPERNFDSLYSKEDRKESRLNNHGNDQSRSRQKPIESRMHTDPNLRSEFGHSSSSSYYYHKHEPVVAGSLPSNIPEVFGSAEDQIRPPTNLPVLLSYHSDYEQSKIVETQGQTNTNTDFRSCYLQMENEVLPIDSTNSKAVVMSLNEGKISNFLGSNRLSSSKIKSSKIADALSEKNTKNSILLYKLEREKNRIVNSLEDKIKSLEKNGKMMKTKLAVKEGVNMSRDYDNPYNYTSEKQLKNHFKSSRGSEDQDCSIARQLLQKRESVDRANNLPAFSRKKQSDPDSPLLRHRPDFLQYSEYRQYFPEQLPSGKKTLFRRKGTLVQNKEISIDFTSNLTKKGELQMTLFITPLSGDLKTVSIDLSNGRNLILRSEVPNFEVIKNGKQQNCQISCQMQKVPFQTPSVTVEFRPNKHYKSHKYQFYLPCMMTGFMSEAKHEIPQNHSLYKHYSAVSSQEFEIDRRWNGFEKIQKIFRNSQQMDSQGSSKQKVIDLSMCLKDLQIFTKLSIVDKKKARIDAFIDDRQIQRDADANDQSSRGCASFYIATLQYLFESQHGDQ